MTRGTAGNTWIKFELPVELKERFLAALSKTRLGNFESPELAAAAYGDFARREHGEFANVGR